MGTPNKSPKNDGDKKALQIASFLFNLPDHIMYGHAVYDVSQYMTPPQQIFSPLPSAGDIG